MELHKVGTRVNQEIYERLLKLASKERWSIAKVTLVAIETYLKIRKI